MRVDARLQIDDAVGAADDGIEHLANGATNDEVRAEVVHPVDAQDHVVRQLVLDPESNCCTLGFCNRLSMMLMPDAPAPGRMKPVNGSAVDGAKGGKRPVSGSRKKTLPGANLDRQRASVEAALERLDLERDTVVVDAVAAVDAGAGAAGSPVEPDTRPRLFMSRLRSPSRNGRTIGLISSYAADVLDVGVELVAQADIERQIAGGGASRPGRTSRRSCCCASNHERLIRLAAAQRDREQQIAIVDVAVTVVVEVGEVLDELDTALTEHAEVEAARGPSATSTDHGSYGGHVPSSRYPRAETASASSPAARGTRSHPGCSGTSAAARPQPGQSCCRKPLKDTVAALTSVEHTIRVHDRERPSDSGSVLGCRCSAEPMARSRALAAVSSASSAA